jgi:hypothetical protein
VRKSTTYLYVLGLAVVVMTALASAGLVVSAQNSNSSTTMAPANANTTTKKPRRHRRVRKPAADAGDASMSDTATMPKKSGRCDPTQQEQADLSGTYTGKIKHGYHDVRIGYAFRAHHGGNDLWLYSGYGDDGRSNPANSGTKSAATQQSHVFAGEESGRQFDPDERPRRTGKGFVYYRRRVDEGNGQEASQDS